MEYMAIFIAYPWAALVIAAVFALLHVRRGGRALAIAGTAWLLYGLYEYLVHYAIICDAECSVRVDLLLIYPVLILLSLVAIVSIFLRR